MQPHERIIYALDVPDGREARRHAARLRGAVGVFKVGLELFVAEGPEIVTAIQDAGGPVFLDLKLHDIPATVEGALAAAAALHPRFVTVHGDALIGLKGGLDARHPDLDVLAVTALTSLDVKSLSALGLGPALRDPEALAVARAKLARQKGCAGVVCSGREAAAVREVMGKDAVIATPGIRPKWARDDDDQRRTVSPAQAVAAGADYLVVGRPIRVAADPRAAAERIAQEIADAVTDAAAGAWP
jgi:orotidine-5'-phosphate decarboxylase